MSLSALSAIGGLFALEFVPLGAPVPVVARFSLAGGDPRASDLEKSPRGMALELRLPGGSLQHMTMIDTPMFFAAVPRTFLDKMVALVPDPKTDKPVPATLAAFVASHPDAVAQSKLLASRNPPSSYADDSYFGIHTFKLVNRGGATTLVRWRFAPQDGEKRAHGRRGRRCCAISSSAS